MNKIVLGFGVIFDVGVTNGLTDTVATVDFSDDRIFSRVFCSFTFFACLCNKNQCYLYFIFICDVNNR